MNDNNRFLYLLQKYKEGTCNGDEYDEFFSLLLTNEFDDLVKENIGLDFLNHTDEQAGLPPHVAQEIVRNILSAGEKVQQIVPEKRKPYVRMMKWLDAACIVAALATGSFFYFNKSHENKFALIIPQNNIVKENNSVRAMMVSLPDGSVVLLHPKSKIHYPRAFQGEKREVYLQGNAHFDVSHNAEKPFYVFCNNIVTKVLGTSFDIITNDKNGDVEVAVKTGKVQVYENESLQDASKSKTVILTANQRVIYSVETQRVTPMLVEKPLPIALKPVETDSANTKITAHKEIQKHPLFIYEQTSLENVFEDIQQAYGIDIVVENSNLNNCVFTGDVSNKDLFVLLKIICLSTNSDYEVMGTKILIKGKGCSL